MNKTQHQFGGSWTDEKLERVRKYLVAYAKIMNKQRFRFAYIDAFAGTGYRATKNNVDQDGLKFPEFSDKETKEFLEGSVRIALKIKPRFTKYFFIEKDQSRFSELEKLKDEFPQVSSDIVLVNSDANSYLKDLCENRRWDKNRAVLFLDPYGMQVSWKTVAAIASTKAIDLWYLFPLGAVNRMLTKNGKITSAWRAKLDKILGTTEWYDLFYKSGEEVDLLGSRPVVKKIGDFDSIGKFFVDRLKTLFPGVAENPYPLVNSKGSHLYLLCFAASNPKGATTAIKIAQDILKRRSDGN
jgi:three-Cys-motif partner protein